MSPEPWLVVAASARQLAQSAARGGYRVAAIDWFGDLDTRAAAAQAETAAATGALRFDPARLLEAAGRLAPPGRCAGLVCGSGLEDAPDLLAELARGRPLYGNLPATVAAAKDPARFFPLLDELGIPHPDTRLQRPADTDGWLAKRIGAAGGEHILPAERIAPGDGVGIYFQRHAPGRSLSALFLADGRNARVLAFSEQFADPAPGAPHRFGGMIGPVEPPAAVAAELRRSIDRLTGALGLTGLNGMDFLLGADGPLVLELNPRPTAALDLYDGDVPRGLFDWHVQACRGRLPEAPLPGGEVRGFAIHRASRAFVTSAALRLPDFCSDLPAPGTAFAPGDPVCTVRAAAPTAAAAREELERRRVRIERMFLAEAA
ncbi:MAG TPA: ATP-grasp domain-containing protein [Rhodocyclaceae bacterium]|jgi:predicted ATP-grasp superfamily ATP-dependent carboligase|nr:ATP-grasp domain-containing protein [Rhodocyclaceae bacterium]